MTARMTARGFTGLVVGSVVLMAGVSAIAQDRAAEAPVTDEPLLREAIRDLYERKLRATVGVSDEQMEAIRPHIQDIERIRTGSRAELTEIRHQLMRALRGGASDDVLEGLLDRIDAIRDREWTGIREASARVESELSARQRVQWRFLNERFQRELRKRVGEIRQRPPAGETGGQAR